MNDYVDMNMEVPLCQLWMHKELYLDMAMNEWVHGYEYESTLMGLWIYV